MVGWLTDLRPHHCPHISGTSEEDALSDAVTAVDVRREFVRWIMAERESVLTGKSLPVFSPDPTLWNHFHAQSRRYSGRSSTLLAIAHVLDNTHGHNN